MYRYFTSCNLKFWHIKFGLDFYEHLNKKIERNFLNFFYWKINQIFFSYGKKIMNILRAFKFVHKSTYIKSIKTFSVHRVLNWVSMLSLFNKKTGCRNLKKDKNKIILKNRENRTIFFLYVIFVKENASSPSSSHYTLVIKTFFLKKKFATFIL